MQPQIEACYRLLPKVSRTFALNIRILPGDLRPAVTAAYLLFRYADTIEDAPGLGPDDRSELFEAFLDRLDGKRPLRLPDAARTLLVESIPPEENDLLIHGEAVFQVLESLSPEVREIIGSHVAE
ncbi:MAG: squalene/phytoene synthase family protein, partial [Gemmatimonadetes bacterium]|nr:squalene/phytoene synthase family protein [Gemmatimonadota bacterium]